jgi:hypothetical protein
LRLGGIFLPKNEPQKCCNFANLQQKNLKKALPMLRKMPKTTLF